MNTILALVGAVLLSGCAGATAYIHQHVAGIAAASAVASVAASGTSAAVNTVTLIKDVEKK